jgi:hypothetical protein
VPKHFLIFASSLQGLSPQRLLHDEAMDFSTLRPAISAFGEEAERVVRGHPFVAVVAAYAFYIVFSWLFLGPNLVCMIPTLG